MTTNSNNFIHQCMSGEALAEDIYAFIDQWHEAQTNLSLPAYLGMADEEYAVWLEKPEALEFIISARRNRVPLTESLRQNEGTAVAVRSPSQAKADEILAWLRKTHRTA